MPPPAGNKFAAHRGVPIGVVRIEPKYLQFFRNLIDDTLKIKARFRGVDMGRKADDEQILLTVHLPPVVCAALDNGNSELADYLESVGAEYVAGVRRSRSTALRESRQSKGKTKAKRANRWHSKGKAEAQRRQSQGAPKAAQDERARDRHLGPSCTMSGASWCHLGTYLSYLARFLGFVGWILEQSWISGFCWIGVILGPFWSSLGYLGPSRGDLEAILEPRAF